MDHKSLEEDFSVLYWLIVCAFAHPFVGRHIIAVIFSTTVLNGLQASRLKPALVSASL